jgi:hypothetical protein
MCAVQEAARLEGIINEAQGAEARMADKFLSAGAAAHDAEQRAAAAEAQLRDARCVGPCCICIGLQTPERVIPTESAVLLFTPCYC